MNMTKKTLILLLFLITFSVLKAQTTGKIAGMVLDKNSGDPIYGANVLLEGTYMGTSTDAEGEFYLINVPPGIYTLSVQMIGYAEFKVEKLQVSVNRTAYVEAKLKMSMLEGETIIVQAERIATKKDQTSSIRNVTSDEIALLPVENIDDVVSMQAGVVNGHFRGGRMDEVSYMIDGVQVVDAFGGESNSIVIENEVVKDLEVITGTFNAEYGRAMSGVVNAVTKDGSEKFHGSASASFGNYITTNDNIFTGLKNSDAQRRQDYKLQLTGPVWKNKLTFMLNLRKQDNKGYLNGLHRFNVDDYSDFYLDQNENFPVYVDENYYSENTGNNDYVCMDFNELQSFTGKLTSRIIPQVKLSFMFTRNNEKWGDYDHSFKYNPFGVGINHRNADMYTFKVNHMFGNSVFYDLTFSSVENYYGWYVYENPEDNRYVHSTYLNDNGPGFYTGGQQKGHTRRTTKDFNTKWDITWQMNKKHLLKTGFLYTRHDLNHEWHDIKNIYEVLTENENEYYYDPLNEEIVFPNYGASVRHDTTAYTDHYQVKPIEFSAYVQDKMEFEEMVVNLGVRYDYYDPATTYPSQRRNPANQLDFPDNPEKVSQYPDAKPRVQISPRLGLSYQLGNKAILHFSYGHFFQMPPMYAIYQNNSYIVGTTDYETTMGNAQLKSQKTVKYEVGLWQELMPDMGLEVVVYYSDIYNLLSTKIVSTYNQILYGLYTNKDYGNVKGLEIKYDYRYKNFYTNVNYTLQYTRGNADNPTQTFDRAGDSRDPIPRLIPMSWDQRHTFNVTVGYNTDRMGITLTGYYNSGTPYNWSPISENRVANINLYPNNAYQKSTNSVDINGYVQLYKKGSVMVKLNYSIYNVFDRLNEYWVDGTTGRAYTSIIRESDLTSHRSNFNEYKDIIQDPSMYGPPRMIKAGLGVVF